MKRRYLVTIILIVTCLLSSFKIDTSKWSKAYNKNGLLIYTRTTDSGLKEFKAIATLYATVGEVSAVFRDWEAHTDWMPNMLKTELVAQPHSKTRYLYYVIDFPWPLWNRDLITKSNFTKGKDGSVVMKVWCAADKKPEDKDLVRIKVAEGFWKFKPLEDGKTKVVYQYKADPGGIPTGIVNFFLLEGPKGSFQGLKKQIKVAKYKGKDLKWLD